MGPSLEPRSRKDTAIKETLFNLSTEEEKCLEQEVEDAVLRKTCFKVRSFLSEICEDGF